jgi:hypothetical protein
MLTSPSGSQKAITTPEGGTTGRSKQSDTRNLPKQKPVSSAHSLLHSKPQSSGSSSSSAKIAEYQAGVNELSLEWMDAGRLVDAQTLKLLQDWDTPDVRTKPVFIGFILYLTNSKRTWSRNQLRQYIKANKHETKPGGKLHHLESYFTADGKCKVHYHIDHIIPIACGGVDHPRNYALMPVKWNQYFGQWHTIEKQRYLGLTVSRRVREFVRWLRKNQTINWENLDKW